MTISSLKTILGTMRPPFLLLTVSMVFLATAMAYYHGFKGSFALFLLVLLGALAAHISVNMLNEYEDYHSGLDNLTQRTAFSGGSGSLQANESVAEMVGQLGYLFLGFVITLGLFFIYLRGWALLPLGLLGVAIVMLYTTQITKIPWLCLISPGLAFGPLMIMGSYFVLTGEFSWAVFGVSLIPFFLVNNLLLLNQFPDEQADRQVGRFNLLMLLGSETSATIFNVSLLASYLILVIMVILGALPNLALLGLLTLVFALPLMQKTKRFHHDVEKLHPFLGLNVLINLLTPLLISLGVWSA